MKLQSKWPRDHRREQVFIRSVDELERFAGGFGKKPPPAMKSHLEKKEYDQSVFNWIGLSEAVPMVIAYRPTFDVPSLAYTRAFWTEEGLLLFDEYRLANRQINGLASKDEGFPTLKEIESMRLEIRDENNRLGLIRSEGDLRDVWERPRYSIDVR